MTPHLLNKICLSFGSFCLASFAAVYQHAVEKAFIAIEWHVVLVLNMALGYATFFFNPAARKVEDISWASPLGAAFGTYSGGKIRSSFYAPWGFLQLMFAMYYFTSPYMYWKGNYIGRKEKCEAHILISAAVYVWDVNIYDPRWIIAAKIFSVIGIGLGLLSTFYGFIFLIGSLAPSIANESKEVDYSLSYTFLQLFFGGSTIAIVEVIIQRNRVNVSASSITSSGQLIPLRIGAMTLAVVLLSWLQWIFISRGPWPLLDRFQGKISATADRFESWVLPNRLTTSEEARLNDDSVELHSLRDAGNEHQEERSLDETRLLHD